MDTPGYNPNTDRMPADTAVHVSRGLLLFGLAAIAGLFCIVVAFNLFITYGLLMKTRPLDNPAIESLIARLKDNPGDANLRAAIRELDRHARSAFYLCRQRMETGLVLLAGGLAMLTATLARALHLRRPVPRPGRGDAGSEAFREARTARVFVLILGVMLAMTAVILMAVMPAADRNSDAPASAAVELPGPDRCRVNWVGFRGWHGLGLAGSHQGPVAFDGPGGTGIIWKVPVPLPGYNSPIVWDGRVWLSGADAKTRAVYCFDTVTGQLQWTHTVTGVAGSPVTAPKVTDDTGYAASTMATDGVRVYAVFANGDLAGCDMEGRQVWARNLGMPDNHYGHSSSLIVHEDTLFVQYDHNAGSTLFAVDGAAGDDRWVIERKADISWSSPVLVTAGDRLLLILASSTDVRAYDPADGTEIWRNACLAGEVAPSPAAANGLIFVTNEGAGLTAIAAATGKTAWTDEVNYDYPDVSSPLATARFLYLAPSTGNVFCIDPRTGAMLWEHGFDYAFYASPLAIGDRVMLLDRKGNLTVFADNGRFET